MVRGSDGSATRPCTSIRLVKTSTKDSSAVELCPASTDSAASFNSLNQPNRLGETVHSVCMLGRNKADIQPVCTFK